MAVIGIDGTRNGARYRSVRDATLVGTAGNILLAAGKLVVGFLGHSQALIADGVHSLSDLVSDAVVLTANRYASQGADEDHPYGHARIETAASVLIGVLLVGIAAGIIYDAVRRLLEPALLLEPGVIVLVVAVISVLTKELLYQYTLRVARRVRSNILHANAWHHRTDAVSSVIVIIGVTGTLMGFTYLDAIAAMVVALLIAKVGWNVVWNSVRELVDTALERDRVERIRRTIKAVSGVRDLYSLRTRRMGGDAMVDVHLRVDPRLSVSEGHQISETVRARVIQNLEEVNDVVVHIDPDDDTADETAAELPERNEMSRILQHRWEAILGDTPIDEMTFHYMAGRVSVDVVLPLAAVSDAAAARTLAARMQEAVADLPQMGEVDVRFH